MTPKILIPTLIVLICSSTAFADHGYTHSDFPDHGGSNEQAQGQIGINTNRNQNTANSSARSNSNSSSTSNSGGNNLSVDGGRHSSSSESSGGASSATTGSIAIDNSDEYTASSAASVYAGYCQTGGSGQVDSGGFSIIGGDPLCEFIRMADRSLLAAQQAKENNDTAMYNHYMDLYHENLADANNLVQGTGFLAYVQRVATQLTIPAAFIVAVLIL